MSVKVKNTGRSVWPAADFTVLVKHVERPANVPANCADLRATIELAEDRAPDAERVVTGRLTGSVYPGYWELSARVVRKKYGLGKERKVDVLVDCDMDAEMVSVRCDDATKMKVGRKYEFRVRVRNTGKTAWNVDLCELACRVLDTEWGDEAAAEKSFGKPVPLPKGEMGPARRDLRLRAQGHRAADRGQVGPRVADVRPAGAQALREEGVAVRRGQVTARGPARSPDLEK